MSLGLLFGSRSVFQKFLMQLYSRTLCEWMSILRTSFLKLSLTKTHPASNTKVVPEPCRPQSSSHPASVPTGLLGSFMTPPLSFSTFGSPTCLSINRPFTFCVFAHAGPAAWGSLLPPLPGGLCSRPIPIVTFLMSICLVLPQQLLVSPCLH